LKNTQHHAQLSTERRPDYLRFEGCAHKSMMIGPTAAEIKRKYTVERTRRESRVLPDPHLLDFGSSLSLAFSAGLRLVVFRFSKFRFSRDATIVHVIKIARKPNF
jgi:hypothetical protein